jgi:hypothetical protein
MIGELRIMDKEAGDLPISWDSDDDDQVEIAAFDKAKSKGMVMYKTDKKGNKGEVITKFDKNAERIIAAPALVGG